VAERADVVVIGMGPGGEDVAGRLALSGLDVVGIDQRLVGTLRHMIYAHLTGVGRHAATPAAAGRRGPRSAVRGRQRQEEPVGLPHGVDHKTRVPQLGL
jgi:choline dehydrogenase-like flavoprotein